MEYKKAVAILKTMLERPNLESEEKEAIVTAIGVLGWSALSESKIKERGERRKKSTEW